MNGIDVMLKPSPKVHPPRAGYFGKCGKMIIKPYTIPEEDRYKIFCKFREHVVMQEDGCWEWTGRIHNGYGVCPTNSSSRWAHRVSYALFNGDIKEGMHIDHKCRNRKCVNPDHLEQVTPIENYQATQRRRLRDIKQKQEENGQLTLWK